MRISLRSQVVLVYVMCLTHTPRLYHVVVTETILVVELRFTVELHLLHLVTQYEKEAEILMIKLNEELTSAIKVVTSSWQHSLQKWSQSALRRGMHSSCSLTKRRKPT